VPRLEDEVVYWALAFGAWPAIMVTAMFLTGDLELPERMDKWLDRRALGNHEPAPFVAEREPADEEFTTGILAGDEGWAVDPDFRLTGSRWWRHGLGDDPTILAVLQDDFVFEPHWCVYELERLEPRLVWAVPLSAVPTIQKLVGDAVQPSQPWVPRRAAIHYPWKPVPAYVGRSLGATAAWAGRQRSAPGCRPPARSSRSSRSHLRSPEQPPSESLRRRRGPARGRSRA
jgi:hypothetical protein